MLWLGGMVGTDFLASCLDVGSFMIAIMVLLLINNNDEREEHKDEHDDTGEKGGRKEVEASPLCPPLLIYECARSKRARKQIHYQSL